MPFLAGRMRVLPVMLVVGAMGFCGAQATVSTICWVGCQQFSKLRNCVDSPMPWGQTQ